MSDAGREERALLRCEACGHSTAVAIGHTDERCIVTCDHCGGSIYWHVCEACGLRYVGGATSGCPVCLPGDDDELVIDHE